MGIVSTKCKEENTYEESTGSYFPPTGHTKKAAAEIAETIEADIYEILPEILELWGTNLITDVQSKKNLKRAAGK